MNTETRLLPPDSKLDQILSISARHFSEKGFEAASLDLIAREVGLHKATLYHYVESKYDILDRCLNRHMAEYADILARIEARKGSPEDLVREVFRTHAHAQANEFGACISAVGSEALRHEPAQRIRAFQGKLSDAVTGLLERGVEEGAFRPVPAATAAQLAIGSFNWIWRWRKPSVAPGLDAIVEDFLDLFFNGFALGPTPVPPHQMATHTSEPGSQLKEKHRSLLMTAARMFSENGYEATSLGEIADEVGLHKATLYHYVRNKATILAQCLEVSFDGVEELEANLSDRNRDAVRNFCEFLEHLVEAQNNDFGRCLNLIGPAPLKGEARDRIRKFQRRLQLMLEQILGQGRDAGLFRDDISITLTASFIFGATNWVPHWLRTTPGCSTADLLPAFEDIFLNGIRQR